MMTRDWTGNAQSTHTVNIRRADAAAGDYYATAPRAVELLLEQERFEHPIWEPACGEGHISETLKAHGLDIYASTDLYDRGYGLALVDFLSIPDTGLCCDVITNPPYKCAKEFVSKALEVVADGCKVAMFLKLTFLEGQRRRELFKKFPPRVVYVSSARLECGKNGVFTGESAVAYCWIVWVKGWQGDTVIRWIN